MKDLLEQLDRLLVEGDVQPGEKREISFRLNKLTKLEHKISEYQGTLNSIKYNPLPKELKNDQDAIAEKLEAFIEKIRREKEELSAKQQNAGPVPLKLDKLFKGIEKNCSQIVKIYKQINNSTLSTERFLYRGIRSSEDALYSLPFTVRRPKDSNTKLDELADNALKNHGFEARRSNSIFTTGSRSHASNYGHTVYIIFPFDDFHFTFSKTIGDLILRNDYLSYFVNEDVRQKMVNLLLEQFEIDEPINNPVKMQYYSKDQIENMFTPSGTTDVDPIIKLISNTSFSKRAELEALYDNLFTDDSGFMDYMKFVNDDIYAAITSNHEVYVNSKFYAVNVRYISELRQLLINSDVSKIEVPARFGEMPDVIYGKGDIIEFIDGEHKGKLGTVHSAKLKDVNIKTSYYGDNIPDVPITDIKLYPEPKNFDFNIGDRVIITTEDSTYYGHSGEIIIDHQYYYSVKLDIGVESYFYNIELIKETPEMQEYYSNKKTKLLNIGEQVIISNNSSNYYGFEGTLRSYESGGKLNISLVDMNVSLSKNLSEVTAKNKFTGKIRPPLHKGDRVKVIEGPYVGKVGEIKGIYSDGDVFIRFEDHTTAYVEVKKIKTTVEASPMPMQTLPGSTVVIGNLVKVTGTMSSYTGRVGIVNEIREDSFSEPAANIIDADQTNFWVTTEYLTKLAVFDKEKNIIDIGDTVKTASKEGEIEKFAYAPGGKLLAVFKDGNKKHSISVNKLLKVDESQKIKIGDYVKVSLETSALKGEKGQVIDILNSQEVTVKLDSEQLAVAFAKNDLQVQNQATMDAEDKLSKGDRVIILPGTTYEGFKGTIVTIGSSYITVVLDRYPKRDGPLYPETFKPDEIQKIYEPEKTFTPGDKVSVKNPDEPIKIGTIINDIDSDGEYRIEFENGFYEYSRPSYMRKHIPEKEPQFKVGEYAVVLTDMGTDYLGEIGKVINVTNIDKHESVELEFEGGNTEIFDPDELEQVDPPETEEPEQNTVQSSDDDHIKIDDKVIVIKGKHTGYKGIVDYIWKSGGQVDVKDTITGNEISVPDISYVKKLDANTDSKSNNDSESNTITSSTNYKFKIGDRVKVIKTEATGKYGTITEIDPKSIWPFKVEYADTLDTGIFQEDELELATQQDSTPKIGDQVKVSSAGKTFFGKVIKIIPGNTYPYEIEYKDEYSGKIESGIFKEDELTVISDNSETSNTSTNTNNELSFAVGDLVYVKNNNMLPNGTLGIIHHSGKTSSEVRILEGLSAKSIYDISNDDLEKVPRYQKGDRVMVINSNFSTFGKIGTVIYDQDSASNLITITIDGEPHSHSLHKAAIKKIPDEEQKKEQPETTSALQQGDSVEVIDSTSSFYGNKGIVVTVGKEYADVAFTTDYSNTGTFLIKNLSKLVYQLNLPPALNIGDKVKVIDPDSVNYGDTFIISDIGGDGNAVYLETEDGKIFTVASADSLEVVS